MGAVARRMSSRLPDATAIALVALTVLAGPAVFPRLPAEMVVGWHLGLDGEVSVTRGPRVVGLVAVPAMSVSCYGATLLLRRLAQPLGAFQPGSTERRLLDVGAVLVLALACAAQSWLIQMNL